MNILKAKTPYAEKLEPLARYLRFTTAVKHLPKDRKIKLVDLGCGPEMLFYYLAPRWGITFDTYIAIDPLIIPTLKFDKKIVNIIKQFVIKEIPLPDNSVDFVFSSSFIEHVDYPKEILNEVLRILKKDGLAIFTTPTPKAKRLLEFLAFKFNLISQEGVLEHKQYLTLKNLQDLLKDSPYSHTVRQQYFEFGLNNLFILRRL